MWPRRPRGGRYGPREKLGAFSRIVRSVTLGRSDNVAKPSRAEMEETKMSEEAKDDVRQVTVERLQRSHGRLIQVVSVFPVQGSATPEDKLKALIDLDAQQGKLCA